MTTVRKPRGERRRSHRSDLLNFAYGLLIFLAFCVLVYAWLVVNVEGFEDTFMTFVTGVAVGNIGVIIAYLTMQHQAERRKKIVTTQTPVADGQ